MIDRNRIDNDFGFHGATPETIPMHEEVRSLCKNLALNLTNLCPASRELSLAITNLEQTMYWANASIARNLAPLSV